MEAGQLPFAEEIAKLAHAAVRRFDQSADSRIAVDWLALGIAALKIAQTQVATIAGKEGICLSSGSGMQLAVEGVLASISGKVNPLSAVVHRQLIGLKKAAEVELPAYTSITAGAWLWKDVIYPDLVDRIEAVLRSIVPHVRVVGEYQTIGKARAERILSADREGDGQITIEKVHVVDFAHLVCGIGREAALLGRVLCGQQGRESQCQEQ